ncbi:MAG: hypothetical protein ACM3JB_14920 [Acidobacteriaceae bacterium]
MENNERDRKLDQWLDEALSDYNAAEPRFGLEQRVINRIRSEGTVRARRWNLWRWMPAFGAIAAIVVVAVAIRPVMEKKAPERELTSRINTYSSAEEPKTKIADQAADTAGSAGQDLPKKMAETKDQHGDSRTLRRELALSPAPGDRKHLASARETTKQNQNSVSTDLNKAPVASNDVVAEAVGSRPGEAAPQVAPPPPPPPPAAETKTFANQPVLAEAMRMTTRTAPTKEAEASGAIVNSTLPNVAEQKPETSALLSLKDSRRKEAHAKPENARPDANAMDVFGVRVSFETSPTTARQRFPSPVPLSQQEKAALAMGQQLKDDAVVRKTGDKLPDIEIKPIEIKPLEGPEK